MATKKDRGSKTETLSLRLDPKTKFILEFVARIKGQTLTIVVERAIREACDRVTIGEDRNEERSTWADFWDPHEGVRTLKLLNCRHYRSSFDEDELLQFTLAHEEFFYDQEKRWPEGWHEPNREYLQILWPKIAEYREIWRTQREKDYWAAGRAMKGDLLLAQVKAPTWPRPPKSERADMDDEIPF